MTHTVQKIQNIKNGNGIFFLGDDVKISNMNTSSGDQTITNYFGDSESSRAKNNGDGTYTVKYRLKFGELDLEGWREHAEELEEKIKQMEQASKTPEPITDVFFKLIKLIAAAIAKRFGF